MTPFNIVKLISEKSEYERSEVVSDYNVWIVNKAMCNMFDTVFFAHEMSQNSHLDKDIQFDFYMRGVPKGKRFGKWFKASKEDDELINSICTVLKVNRTVAKRYLALLSEEEKKKLLVVEGGK